MSKRFPFAEVEPRWQKYWLDHKTFAMRREVEDEAVERDLATQVESVNAQSSKGGPEFALWSGKVAT